MITPNQNGKYEIPYNNRVIQSIHYDSTLSDQDIEQIRKDFYTKPTVTEVKETIYEILHGNNNMNIVDRYFTDDLRHNVQRYDTHITVNEYMSNNDLIRLAVASIKKHPVFFTGDLTSNLKQKFRVGGTIVSRVGSYPIKSVKSVLNKYNVNNNYYDYSCGWGSRMMGSLASNINYFGTDPNHDLTKELINLYKLCIEFNAPKCDIRTQGSEVFVPEWENKMGVAFSSPPYFNLEEYFIGNQSTNDRNYNEWLNEYWLETTQNIHKYLVQDGYFILNVKDFSTFELTTDMCKIIEENGFVFSHFETLQNPSRYMTKHKEDADKEYIFVFRKIGFQNSTHINEIDEW